MKRVLVLMLFITLTLGISNSALADLIFTEDIFVDGSGLGAVNTLVTVHDSNTGGPGSNGIESGGINQDGSFSPVTQFGIEGGDNLAINQVLTFNTALNFAAVVNLAETGQDLTATLTNLYLTFSNGTPASDFTAYYTGAPIDLTSGEGTGTGGSGFVFALDDAQYASVVALGPSVTVSGGVQFALGTTNDGNETVYIIQTEGGQQQVPEPTTLLLLGSVLAGFGFYRRMRK
jgi:hypothetical protein